MNHNPTPTVAKRGRLVWAAFALVTTVVCGTTLGTVVGALVGSVLGGAMAGVIWGLVFGLVWVLPVFLLRRRRKNEGHTRDPGYYGGGEGGGIGGGPSL